MENKTKELLSKQPIANWTWIHRDKLRPNDYNPNTVQKAELDLLKISILQDGWTQPIVANQDGIIVDGFHRWTISADIEVYSKTDGFVPIVPLFHKSKEAEILATVRHNRARGTHSVLPMAKIVEALANVGMSKEQIMVFLGMESEEVIRLLLRVGISETDIIKKSNWSNTWNPS